MSVVEKAIEKLQVARAQHSQRAPAPIGEVVVTGSPADSPALNALARNQQAPERTAMGRHIALDRVAMRQAGYLPEAGVDRRLADEFRILKRPLLDAARAAPGVTIGSPRAIMVASALPGDGKTFTSINLALSLARERDVRVVLVDADVPKPHVSQLFGAAAEPGLLDLLADHSLDIESLILPTDVPGLAVLPAGQPREGATELLSSARMDDLTNTLLADDPGRLVVFDSPPILASSESRPVARLSGQVLLVVRSGHTPRPAVLSAIEELGEGKALSLILNQGRISLGYGNYGLGDYGYYGENSQQRAD